MNSQVNYYFLLVFYFLYLYIYICIFMLKYKNIFTKKIIHLIKKYNKAILFFCIISLCIGIWALYISLKEQINIEIKNKKLWNRMHDILEKIVYIRNMHNKTNCLYTKTNFHVHHEDDHEKVQEIINV